MTDDDNDYPRPRRPNADTITYLKSLPLLLDLANEQISEFLNQDSSEYPSILGAALSALEEIRHEIASLAGDEEASQILETIAHIALPYSETATRIMFAGLKGYHIHLATHRYGSHVVQTALQLGPICNSKKDLALHEDSPLISSEDLPSLKDLIHEMVEELTPTASHLAIHLCGSHVLRSLICLLGGVKINQKGQTLRRGKEKSKKKKKKKKDASSEDSQRGGNTGTIELVYQQKDSKFKTSLLDPLQNILESIWDDNSNGGLQEMVCHPSAGPLLIISLRVLTYAYYLDKDGWEEKSKTVDEIDQFRLGIVKPQLKFESQSPAHNFVKRILLLDSPEKAGDVIYGMSGEIRGSHVLETLMRISSDDVYSLILEKGGFVTSLAEYAEHDVSNFVVQALFTTVRNKDQAELLLKAVEKLITNGYVINAANKRVGVLWRALELAAKFRIQQESILKAIRIGSGLAINSAKEEITEPEGKKKKQRQKAFSIPLQDCIPRLLNLKKPVRDGDRVTLCVEGTRAVYHLLRFAPGLCGDVLEGITETISPYELELLAKDGLGSRCIWDGILEGARTEKVFLKAMRTLLTKLSGRWVALASDRVGHHCVIKLFKALDLQDKAILVAELSHGYNRLTGSAMGRTVDKACAISSFLEGENVWEDAIRKMQNDKNFLSEILEEGTKKKKRKRKRGNDTEKLEPSAVDTIASILSGAVKT